MLFFANLYKAAHSQCVVTGSVHCAEQRGGIVPFCEKVCPRQRELWLLWLDRSCPPFLSLPFLAAVFVPAGRPPLASNQAEEMKKR